MPEPAKAAPDAETTLADDCDDTSKDELIPVDSRAWRWIVRVSNAGLFVAPLLLLSNAVYAAGHARVTVELDRPQNGFSRVQVDLDPAWWERALIASPALMATVAVALICHALYRIEVNIAAGHQPGYRQFTSKDTAWLMKAAAVPLLAFLGALVLSTAVPLWCLPSADHLAGVVQLPPTVTESDMLLTLFVLLGSIVTIYKHGKQAYDRQVDVV